MRKCRRVDARARYSSSKLSSRVYNPSGEPYISYSSDSQEGVMVNNKVCDSPDFYKNRTCCFYLLIKLVEKRGRKNIFSKFLIFQQFKISHSFIAIFYTNYKFQLFDPPCATFKREMQTTRRVEYEINACVDQNLCHRRFFCGTRQAQKFDTRHGTLKRKASRQS